MPSTKSKTKPKPKFHTEWSFEAIGTHWWIGLYDEPPINLRAKVTERIDAFDKVYSRFRADSLVTKMGVQAGTYEFPVDAYELFAFYRQLYDVTNGKVTPLIGNMLSDAGYDANYSLRPQQLSPVATWDEVFSVQGTTVQLKQPALLDFGAAGKGYLVDIIAKLLQDNGLSRFCIDASGDMVCAGLDEPLRIGLEHPSDPLLAIGEAELNNRALCASAPNRRRWSGYHHIIDPQRAASPEHIAGVWTIADTTMQADGLATALFFVPPEKLQQFSFEYVILFADGRAQYSPDWPGQLY